MSLIVQPINCTLKSDPKAKSSADAMIAILAGDSADRCSAIASAIQWATPIFRI